MTADRADSDEDRSGASGGQPMPAGTWAELLPAFVDADRVGKPIPDWAWTAISDRLLPAVRAWFSANRIDLRDRDAADVVQDVLVKLQDPVARQRWTASAYPGAYLLTMARNAVRDLQRREKARDARLVPWKAEERERIVQGPIDAEEPATANWPDGLVVSQILGRLSPDERDLLERRYLRSQPIADIANALDLSYAATAQRLFRLVRRLRAETDDYLKNGDTA